MLMMSSKSKIFLIYFQLFFSINLANCTESKREHLKIEDLHEITHEELEKLSKELAKLYFQRLGRSSLSHSSPPEQQDIEDMVRI